MKEEDVNIRPLQLETISIEVEGTTALLMNQLGEEVQDDIESKYQKGEVKAKKKAQDILKHVEEKIHRLPDGTVCFPSPAFKRGIEDAAIELDGMTKKQVDRGMRFLVQKVPILFEEQVINKTWGRKSGRNRAPYLIYRPEFRNWSCVLHIEFDSTVITPQAIITLLNHAGYYSGLGDWRPGLGGDYYGIYRVKENEKDKV